MSLLHKAHIYFSKQVLLASEHSSERHEFDRTYLN